MYLCAEMEQFLKILLNENSNVKNDICFFLCFYKAVCIHILLVYACAMRDSIHTRN